ncbi:MAG: leucyl aminopeptidase, partial [Mycoplasmataceae bacterium]|nr:leucyl aminopeptidase [Mycoplasmataceae bacterium]
IAEGKDKPTTALVGKGVCFDSGGYDLKPAPHMRWMKFDMSGAATVMGTVLALAKNKVKTNVVALGAMVANEIGPNAQHPDDIWQSYSGKYVEIDNTDAEGRLIMADAIAYAVKDLKEELKVNRLIDISTLTGAMIYALGDTFTGVWCTKDNSWQKYELAAKEAGELVWRMPFHKDFLDMLKSDIADISNSVSKPQGGSSRAAEFLKFFTDGIDYIHLDVAGTTDRNNKGQASMLRSMYNFVK